MFIEKCIREAIMAHKTVEVDYSAGKRLIEPHCLGLSKDGDLLLRAFQIEGASESGEKSNWKLFRLDRLNSAQVTNDNFSGPRPQYNPDDPVMKGGIIARI